MNGLTQGHIVHYVSQLDGQVGTDEYAAIVSRVYKEHHRGDFPSGSLEAACDEHNDGDVCLHVFADTKSIVKDSVPYSAEKAPNSWHWIERA